MPIPAAGTRQSVRHRTGIVRRSSPRRAFAAGRHQTGSTRVTCEISAGLITFSGFSADTDYSEPVSAIQRTLLTSKAARPGSSPRKARAMRGRNLKPYRSGFCSAGRAAAVLRLRKGSRHDYRYWHLRLSCSRLVAWRHVRRLSLAFTLSLRPRSSRLGLHDPPEMKGQRLSGSSAGIRIRGQNPASASDPDGDGQGVPAPLTGPLPTRRTRLAGCAGST